MNKVKQFFNSIYEFLFVDKTAKRLDLIMKDLETNFKATCATIKEINTARSKANEQHFTIMETLNSLSHQHNSFKAEILKALKEKTMPDEKPEPVKQKDESDTPQPVDEEQKTLSLFKDKDNDSRTKNWSAHGIRLVKRMLDKSKTKAEIANSLNVSTYMVKKAITQINGEHDSKK